MSARPGVVGAFILGAAGLGVAAILFFGGSRMFSKTMHAVAYFNESVAGLEAGSPVTFNGVRIGQVKNVALEFSTASMSARIPVVLEFQPEQITWEGGKRLAEDPKDFQRLVQAGLRAQLEMQSFVTGQVRVNLEFQPQTPVRLTGESKDMPEIPTVPSELGKFLAQLSRLDLQDLARTAQNAFASLDHFLTHADSLMEPLAGNATEALIAARDTFRTGDEAIASLKQEASTSLHNLDALLVDVRHQVGPRSAELSRVFNSADYAVRQASVLLDSLNSLAQPRSPFRSNLEATMRDLAATASSLRDFASTVERNPNAVLLGRSGR